MYTSLATSVMNGENILIEDEFTAVWESKTILNVKTRYGGFRQAVNSENKPRLQEKIVRLLAKIDEMKEKREANRSGDITDV